MRKATLLAAGLLASAAPAYAQDTKVVDTPDIEIELMGRVMLDQTFASADEADENFNTNEARRLRLGVKGKYGERIKYKFELNTDSSGDVNAEDAYLQWYPTGESWSVVVGQDNTHNSFDELTSSRFSSHIERAAFTDAFQLDRRLGVSVLDQGKNWTAAAGLHTVNLEEDGLDEGWAASARVTGTPVTGEQGLVHVGASWRYRDQGSDQSLLRYRQRPFSHGLNRIVSTGRAADKDTFYGLEAYGLTGDGRFWLGGEYALTKAESTPGGIVEDADFDGAYLEAGAMLGGARTYKNGKWDRPKVSRPIGKGGMGALLLSARYDTLDLTDDAVDGGGLDTWSLTADWYLTKYAHIAASAFVADANLGTQTSGLGGEFADLIAAGVQDEDVSGIVIRAQFDFGTKLGKF